ncbi:hypothetical protein WJX81_007941 [Elliptochloris bilobata]|uniref:Uncharacterized protein n=1 Tax=Elliptochloris bilobata TaxID=381761 RepID=A0AAW1RP59_9CHLO
MQKVGVGPSELPKDLQEALARGALSGADVLLWLRVRAMPVVGWVCQHWPAFRDRVMGNPRFLRVLAVEEVLGCTAKTIAEVQTRGAKVWEELDFLASDLSLEIIGDFAVVWLLSPRRNFQPLPTRRLPMALAALPAHCLQVETFSVGQRVATVALRGSQFFAVGFLSSLLGHGLTVYLVHAKRDRRDAMREEARAEVRAGHGGAAARAAASAEFGEDAALAPVLDNSLGWGAFMATSANVRYQLVNAFEERFLERALSGRAARLAATCVLRFSNTYLGSAMWVACARVAGLQ